MSRQHRAAGGGALEQQRITISKTTTPSASPTEKTKDVRPWPIKKRSNLPSRHEDEDPEATTTTPVGGGKRKKRKKPRKPAIKKKKKERRTFGREAAVPRKKKKRVLVLVGEKGKRGEEL